MGYLYTGPPELEDDNEATVVKHLPLHGSITTHEESMLSDFILQKPKVMARKYSNYLFVLVLKDTM